MPRDNVIKKLISPEALFHRFADVFRAVFLVCFSILALVGLGGTGYFAYQVVAVDSPDGPTPQVVIGQFEAPSVQEFGQFAERLLQGSILWPQVMVPEAAVSSVVAQDLTDKETKAIQAGAALLETLIAARGVEKNEQRRQQVSQLIAHTHKRLRMQPDLPDLSFATLFFDHMMEASMQPVFFPTQTQVAGQARERIDRFLTDYPLLHVNWFADQVVDRAYAMARGSDQREKALVDYQLSMAIADQRMQRNAVLTLVSLIIFALSALLFLLVRIERNQTLQTQYMANRYVMYMPTAESDP